MAGAGTEAAVLKGEWCVCKRFMTERNVNTHRRTFGAEQGGQRVQGPDEVRGVVDMAVEIDVPQRGLEGAGGRCDLASFGNERCGRTNRRAGGIHVQLCLAQGYRPAGFDIDEHPHQVRSSQQLSRCGGAHLHEAPSLERGCFAGVGAQLYFFLPARTPQELEIALDLHPDQSITDSPIIA